MVVSKKNTFFFKIIASQIGSISRKIGVKIQNDFIQPPSGRHSCFLSQVFVEASANLKHSWCTWNLKHLFINDCFNWMIPNLYVGNGCFTKHPFKTGCLGYQVEMSKCQNHSGEFVGWGPRVQRTPSWEIPI